MGSGSEGFWAPRDPQRASYSLGVKVARGRLTGEESITLRNTSPRPLCRLVLKWNPGKRARSRIVEGGGRVKMLQGAPENALALDLEAPLEPGEEIVLQVGFASALPERRYGTTMLGEWFPRFWWGYPVHDDFELDLKLPQGYRVAVSGSKEGDVFRAHDIRRFGVVLGRGLEEVEEEAHGVCLSAIHTRGSGDCVGLVMETAKDVIGFYKDRFGFYPQPFLRIVPGMATPAGGFPFATGIISIHGQEKFGEAPERFWRWITAHEIGHQYWGEHVLEGATPSWLSIGLGIFADREYCVARRLDPSRHRNMVARYLDGVNQGLDTTVEIPREQIAQIEYDHNNIVVHGKGFAIISSLDTVIGREAFMRSYLRCLKEFKGRRLDSHQFQAVCEEESDQGLDWFFSQWVRSNRVLAYRVRSVKSRNHRTQVVVERIGDLEMPIPVEVKCEDGSAGRQTTDRALRTNTLVFEMESDPAEVILDPDSSLPLLQERPKSTSTELIRRISDMGWTGSGDVALELLPQAREGGVRHAGSWFKLGLALYDGSHYPQALEAFRVTEDVSTQGIYRAAGVVWQGHMQDLLGNRAKAMERYREAAKEPFPGLMRHDQYGIALNDEWIRLRLKEPFARVEAVLRE